MWRSGSGHGVPDFTYSSVFTSANSSIQQQCSLFSKVPLHCYQYRLTVTDYLLYWLCVGWRRCDISDEIFLTQTFHVASFPLNADNEVVLPPQSFDFAGIHWAFPANCVSQYLPEGRFKEHALAWKIGSSEAQSLSWLSTKWLWFLAGVLKDVTVFVKVFIFMGRRGNKNWGLSRSKRKFVKTDW